MLVSLWTALIGLVFIKNWMQFYRHVSGSRGYILSFVQKLWCITVCVTYFVELFMVPRGCTLFSLMDRYETVQRCFPKE